MATSNIKCTDITKKTKLEKGWGGGQFCTLRQSSVHFADYSQATLLSQLQVFLCF